LDAEEKFALIATENQYYVLSDFEQKASIFRQCLSKTPGDEIARFLIWGAEDSEDWLHRRIGFTTSLSSTSMIGAVMGLGDRHPGNLLIKKKSGKFVPINFESCFVLNTGKGEAVPFRLTKILVNGLEFGKLEGTFRKSCEKVMKLMRKGRRDIMTVIDSLEYDKIGDGGGVLSRSVKEKLSEEGTVKEIVGMMIENAVNSDNLVKMWRGWVAWW
jgi:FKBP12-rapamycin complex-associated protein